MSYLASLPTCQRIFSPKFAKVGERNSICREQWPFADERIWVNTHARISTTAFFCEHVTQPSGGNGSKRGKIEDLEKIKTTRWVGKRGQ